MSKGEGSKIAIKFTEEIINDLSIKLETPSYKFYRWYITSTWSGSRLYLYEIEMFYNNIKINTKDIISMKGSSRYSTSYDVNRLFDGSVPGTSWDANGSLPHWCIIEFNVPIKIDKFNWHTSTGSNKPKDFIFQGSNDGINWIDIYTNTSPNQNNWIEFAIIPQGNEIAFNLIGKERLHIKGDLVQKEYKVKELSKHPTEEKTILLLMQDKFNNAEESIKVSYNADIGNLYGEFGAVQSFQHEFNPIDLIEKLDPYVPENITISNLANVDFIKVNHKDTSNKENISVSLGKATVDFIPVDFVEV